MGPTAMSIVVQGEQGGPVEVGFDGIPGHESKIRNDLGFLDPVAFGAGLTAAQGWVCRVLGAGQSFGTGTLVGPDLVLTSRHVLTDALQAAGTLDAVRCQFDYAILQAVPQQGITVSLRAGPAGPALDETQWAASDGETDSAALAAGADTLDHALLRLERRIGEEPMPAGARAGGGVRGWLSLTEEPPGFGADMPLLILQHPEGDPIRLAMDTRGMIGVWANGNRFRYRTNTLPGSSGAPIFTAQWRIIGLHQLGDLRKPAEYNQGIPIRPIRARLLQGAFAGELTAPPRPAPAPELGQLALQVGDGLRAAAAVPTAALSAAIGQYRAGMDAALQEIGDLLIQKTLHDALHVIWKLLSIVDIALREIEGGRVANKAVILHQAWDMRRCLDDAEAVSRGSAFGPPPWIGTAQAAVQRLEAFGNDDADPDAAVLRAARADYEELRALWQISLELNDALVTIARRLVVAEQPDQPTLLRQIEDGLAGIAAALAAPGDGVLMASEAQRALRDMGNRLLTLVTQHDAWQEIDLAFSVVTGEGRDRPPSARIPQWTMFRRRLLALCDTYREEAWSPEARSFLESWERFGQPVQDEPPEQREVRVRRAERAFDGLRDRCRSRFFVVDKELRMVCESLSTMRLPLMSLLGRL